jgi:23S rRNA pseudouridine955/2504/2580 synthase
MSRVVKREVAADEAEMRLDRWFRLHYPGLTHGRLEKLLRSGQVRVDGGRAKAATRLAAGQIVRIPPLDAPGAPPSSGDSPAPDPAAVAALRERILYRDEWLIALDKPAGLAVQGGTGQLSHLDAMAAALAEEGAPRPSLVHRLDKDTSGVLLLAATRPAARRLAAAFKAKAVRKIYWAVVVGGPKKMRGYIDLPLVKAQARGGERMVAGAPGGGARAALTLYQVIARRPGRGRHPALTWLALTPITGRTHQLRLHAAASGFPILGDGKYGGRRAFPEALKGEQRPVRLALHAREIAVPHPEDGTTVRIVAPLPDDLLPLWRALGFDPLAAEAAVDSLTTYGQGLGVAPDLSLGEAG